jgi:hypothetical protein
MGFWRRSIDGQDSTLSVSPAPSVLGERSAGVRFRGPLQVDAYDRWDHTGMSSGGSVYCPCPIMATFSACSLTWYRKRMV